jgi:hypothetical protein
LGGKEEEEKMNSLNFEGSCMYAQGIERDREKERERERERERRERDFTRKRCP